MLRTLALHEGKQLKPIAVESLQLAPVESYPIGHHSVLEVRSRFVDHDMRSRELIGPEILIRNVNTGAAFDISSALSPGDRLLWGEKWARNIPEGGTTHADVWVPKLPAEKTRANGRMILLSLLHEMGHASAGPLEGKLLKDTRNAYFTRKATRIGASDEIRLNAITFEFTTTMQNERRAWANAFQTAKRINKEVGDDVFDIPDGVDYSEYVYDTSLGSYMRDFGNGLVRHMPKDFNIETLRRNLLKDHGLQERIQLLMQLYDTDLHFYGLDFDEFALNLRAFDVERLRTSVATFDPKSEEEALELAREINTFVPNP